MDDDNNIDDHNKDDGDDVGNGDNIGNGDGVDDEIIPGSMGPAEDPLDADKSVGSSPPRKCAKCNSTCHDAEPTQLGFYLGTWVDILKNMKEYFCLWMVK